MNDLEFKKHLKDLVHGHHHPEEHDWGTGAAPRKRAASKASVKRRAPRKSAKRK
jgi:hypothetical protein